MSYSATYPIHEGYKTSVFADVEYHVEPGYRGSRDEPSSYPFCIVEDVQLYRITKTRKYSSPGHYVDHDERTDLGTAPKWVFDLVEDDTDWLMELAMEDAA